MIRSSAARTFRWRFGNRPSAFACRYTLLRSARPYSKAMVLGLRQDTKSASISAHFWCEQTVQFLRCLPKLVGCDLSWAAVCRLSGMGIPPSLTDPLLFSLFIRPVSMARKKLFLCQSDLQTPASEVSFDFGNCS